MYHFKFEVFLILQIIKCLGSALICGAFCTRRPVITDCNSSWATWLLNNNYMEPTGFDGKWSHSSAFTSFSEEQTWRGDCFLICPGTSYAWMLLIPRETSAELIPIPRHFSVTSALPVPTGRNISKRGRCRLWGCFSREPWSQTPSLASLPWCSRSRSDRGFLHKSSLIEAHSLSHSVWQQPNCPPVNSLLNPIWERESASFRQSYKTDQLLWWSHAVLWRDAPLTSCLQPLSLFYLYLREQL